MSKQRVAVKTKAAAAPAGHVPVLPTVSEIVQSAGKPLDRATRTSMERRFNHHLGSIRIHSSDPRQGPVGEAEADRVADLVVRSQAEGGGNNRQSRTVPSVDFSHVRLHTGRDVAASAQLVGAQAYAWGNRVVFDDQRCTLHSPEGHRTLAHELVHVVQRVGARPLLGAAAVALPFDGSAIARKEAYPRLHETVLKGLIAIARKHPNDGPDRVTPLHELAQSIPEKDRPLLLERLSKPPKQDAFTDYLRIYFPHTRESFLAALDPSAKAAPPKEEMIVVPPKLEGPPPGREGSVFVTNDFSLVKGDPQYIDNFNNDINEAWLPNERALVLQYPNGTALKIALADLVKALDIKSELNPPPELSPALKKRLEELRKSGELTLPEIRGEGPSGYTRITIESATSFHRDIESKVIYPQRNKIPKRYLPRLTHAVEQIEAVRVNQELWLKAAPKLIEIVVNMNWSAPQGMGGLIVSLGRRLKRGAQSAKGLIVKPKSPAPEVTVPKQVDEAAAKAASRVPGKPLPPTKGAALPELKVVGKGTRPKQPAGNVLDDVSDETKTLFAAKPQIKKALGRTPRAARALKKCTSPCFPEEITASQIDRLERMLETAENSGIAYNEKQLTDFLRGKISWKEIESGLDELEKSLLRARGVQGEFGEAARQIGGDRFTPEGRPATAAMRALSGKATGGERLPDVTGQWFPEVRPSGGGKVRGTKDVRTARIPGQIAKKMRGMEFKNWDDFRETFWKMMARDPVLKQGWSPQNLARMQDGLAPFAGRSHLGRPEATGGRSNAVYNLDHKQAIQHGGGVFDLDNIDVVSPRFHAEIGQ